MLEGELISPQELLRQHLKTPGVETIKKACKGDVGEYKCRICSKAFKLKQYVESHIARVHEKRKNVSCDLCGKPCYSQKELTRHMVSHTDVRPFKCKQCEKAFKTKRHLNCHEVIHTGVRDFKCDECDQTFYRSTVLACHKLIHTKEKPYKCSFCGYACRDRSTWRKHEAKHMGSQTIYNCKMCTQKCKDKWRLKLHVAEKHLLLDVKRYECDHCAKKFKCKSTIAQHIRRSHDKVEKHPCSICERVFGTRAAMRAHRTRHYQQRPFQCDRCQYKFKTKNDLERHLVIHMKEKQHPCPICGRLFARKYRVPLHIRRVHQKTKNTPCRQCGINFYSVKYLLKHMSTHEGERRMCYCNYCGFGVLNKPGLISHIRQMHLQHDILKCKKCRKTFLSASQLKVHTMRKHRPLTNNKNVKELKLKNEKYALEMLLKKADDEFSGEAKTSTIECNNNDDDERSQATIRAHVECLKNVPEAIFNKYIRTDGRPENPPPPPRTIIKHETEAQNGNIRKRCVTKLNNEAAKDAINNTERENELESKRPKRNTARVHYKHSNGGVTSNRELNNKDPLGNIVINNIQQNYGKFYQIKLNTVQCYVCFKLFETKEHLMEHCSTHFPKTGALQLNRCPICDYECPSGNSRDSLQRHITNIHRLHLNNRSNLFEYKNNKYTVKLRDKTRATNARSKMETIKNKCGLNEIQIVPSLHNMNRHKLYEIDRRNRQTKNQTTYERKLVRTKAGRWVVRDEALPLQNHVKLKNTEKEDLSTDVYLDKLTEMHHRAKREGKKITFPCDKCEKVCVTLCGMKSHRRIHNTRAKPYRAKVWRHRLAAHERPDERRHKLNIDRGKPKPITKKHKCKDDLKIFYENFVRGSNIEFEHFLRIFNKLDRDGVQDFQSAHDAHAHDGITN